MTAPTMAQLPMVTKEELAAHNTPESLWIAVDGKVFDVTTYTEVHPGGVTILRTVGGTNATAAFHDVGHSEEAQETLHTFLIGTLEQTEETRVRPIFESKIVAAAEAMTQPGLVFYLTTAIVALAKQSFWLVCIVAAAKILWPDFVSTSALMSAIGAISSFWKGAMLSTAASGIGLWIVSSEVGKSLDMTEGLRRYPPIRPHRKALKGPPARPLHRRAALDPLQFQPLVLTERTRVARNTVKFTLQVQDAQTQGLSRIPAGLHVQLRADIEGAPVVRSYTPTEVDTKTGQLELTIKVYAAGKMGNHLLHLPIGGSVDVRGPIGHFKSYHRFLSNHITMIAGGTGITPMWQIIRAICEDPLDDTCVTLLYANQTQADILLRDEIDALATRFPQALKVHYFLSAEKHASWTGERGRINRERLSSMLPAVAPTSKYLVCGPDAMVGQITQDLAGLGCDSPRPFRHATDQVFVF